MVDRIPCVIFDLDGTLADCSHRRHHVEKRPKDWKAFYGGMADDVPNEAVAWLFRAIRNTRAPVGSPMPKDAQFLVPIICTGRPDNYKDITWDWLLHYCLVPHSLYMRQEGDYRVDDVVKRELLNRIMNDHYDPLFVVEDRDRVVAMWREEGLTCLQCAPGDF